MIFSVLCDYDIYHALWLVWLSHMMSYSTLLFKSKIKVKSIIYNSDREIIETVVDFELYKEL